MLDSSLKKGDYIYSMDTHYKNIPYCICQIENINNKTKYYCSYFDFETGDEEDNFIFTSKDINKTVFLSEII